MGLASRLSLANHSDSESFLVVHALFSQDRGQREGFWEVVRHVVSPFDLSGLFSWLWLISTLFLTRTSCCNNSCKWLLWCLARVGDFSQCASPNSRIIERGGWALSRWEVRDYIFLILEVKETFPTRRQKRSDDQVPLDLFTGIYLGWEMHVHIGDEPEIYQIQTQNQANQNDWPKEAWKKCPHITYLNYHEDVTCSACVSIHINCTLFPS